MIKVEGWGGVSVASVLEARRDWSGYAAVLTLEDPGQEFVLRVPAGSPVQQKVLAFEDVDWDNGAAATERHVAAALAFAREAGGGGLLVHCYAGVSRSPALALAIVADRLGPGREDEAALAVASMAPGVDPNERIVALADAVMGRSGALVAAWGRARSARPAAVPSPDLIF